MERIPEPELMDDAAQAHAYAAADFSSSDQAMVDALLARHGADLGSAIVDLGCGPGNITFLLAEALAGRDPAVTVLGVDGAAAMLAIAEERRRRAPFPMAVAFHQELLPCPSLAGRGFSALVSNSLLHHLHDPQRLWQAVQRLAAPGALVLVRDLRRPVDEAAVQRLLERHGAGLDPIVRRDYLHSLRAAFTPAEVRDQLQQAGLTTLAVEAIGEQVLEVRGRLPGRLAR
ncbi:MAG: class I SAM-dependent methyltransferase [Cyanobacteriota bacterium]|nr:class I SAM-dependent methyltransferase [Cyanobacteriota bacterium]